MSTTDRTPPPALPPIDWKPLSEHPGEFEDGDRYLVALRVNNRRTGKQSIEVHEVTIACDEGYFALRDYMGEDFGDWLWDDFEWYADPVIGECERAGATRSESNASVKPGTQEKGTE